MKKPKIRHRDQVGKAFSTTTHQHNNSITNDGKHVQFKNKPSIAMYQQNEETTLVTYNSGADGHYLSEKDRTKLGILILR